MDRLRLIDQLILDECRDGKPELKVYRDSKGIETIGIGRNLQKGITNGEAYHLAHNDIDEVEVELDIHVAWWRKMDEVRQNVLANMCFQLGISRLLKFEKALAHMMIGEYDQAAAEMMDSKWAREDSPKRALRLAEEMRHGGGGHVAVVA